MKSAPICCIAALLLGSTASAAHAAEPAEASTEASPMPDGDQTWLRRWAPERNMAEVGIYGGVLLPSRRIELFEADFGLPDQGYKPLASVIPDLGLRLGYYPLPLFGVEVEGGVLPGRTEAGDGALLWTGRGHLVGQLGWWSVTPFVLVGGGLLGVSSDRTSLGDDVDATMHFGGGAKIYLNHLLQLRVDVRDIIAARRGYNSGVVHNPEILVGLTMTLGRTVEEEESAPPAGVDTDGDGVLDPDDRCKDEPGVADFAGCPVPDSDDDGVLDPDDECKDEAGSPDFAGCPVPDTDADGILDPDDQCKGAAENANGFEDDDGCPDTIPEEVTSLMGIVEGLDFERNDETITALPTPVLERTLRMLRKHPSVRIEISGHTNEPGPDGINDVRAVGRIEALKAFFVSKGIDADRISTRGAGSSEPLPKSRKRRRAKNRRIEFALRKS